tara:strand:+ start:135 stop:881 length:747 start_codon:yes stop_codon:yes gene_type:complete
MSKKVIITSVKEKLKSLYELQCIDSSIDKLRVIRGELPAEIQDLEDEIFRIDSKIDKLNQEKDQVKTDIKEKKELIKNSKELIKRYTVQLENIKNNREFTSLTKELEFQELEIELSEKHINEYKARIKMKDEVIGNFSEELDEKKKDLSLKQSELDSIVAETEKEEKSLIKKSENAKKKIDDRLLNAYQRIRARVRNGLAVVTVDRDACGGCFNKIPPQIQLDIKLHKKVIFCEHCGRILVDSSILSS